MRVKLVTLFLTMSACASAQWVWVTDSYNGWSQRTYINVKPVVDLDDSVYIRVNAFFYTKIPKTIFTPAGVPAWVDITGKPSTFAPSAHSTAYADITGVPAFLVAADIAGKLDANGNGSSLTGLTKSQVGLSNVDNTTDANKPVSSTTQTALDGKQATIAAGTTSQYYRGDKTWQTYQGYTINVQALTSSPADGATVYFGTMPKAPVSAAATSKIYIRKAGTLKIAEIYCYSGTAGTNESWSVNIRVNNTTDHLIATVSASTSERIFSKTDLSITLNVGDYVEIKVVNPTWTTNPLTCIFGGYFYIE